MFSVKFKVNDENSRSRGKLGTTSTSRRSSTTSLGRNLRSPTPSVQSTSLNSILSSGRKKSKDDRKRIRIITSVRGPDSDQGRGTTTRKQYRGKAEMWYREVFRGELLGVYGKGETNDYCKQWQIRQKLAKAIDSSLLWLTGLTI